MTFILKEPKATKETPIICIYHFNNRRLKFSTGELINPAHWNPVQQRPRKTAPSRESLTKYLNRLENRVREMHLELKSQIIEVTPDNLKASIVHNIRTGGTRETLSQFWERYMVEMCPNYDKLKSRDKLRRKKDGYKYAYDIFKAFQRHKDFADITSEWMESFAAYMEKNKYSKNYISKVILILRDVMSTAKKQGLHSNESYKSFTPPKEKADTIYLSIDELLAIHKLKLNPSLSKVRDRFLIGAFTGLRFSDNSKITMAAIRDGLIFDKSKKTHTDVVIPIHWIVDDIMAKYDGGLPPVMSDVWMNKQIKGIGKEAGITTPIIYKGKEVKKHELITSHTARRSAATNMFLAGIPSISIMQITGHKTETEFMKYIRVSGEQNAKLISSHEFFTRPAADHKSSDKS